MTKLFLNSDQRLFGTDGIRGPVETLITPEACLRIGHATGTVAKELGWKTVMIGKDTRLSGYMLESALQARRNHAHR